jgi:gliding motility-associated-like protein
MNKKITLLPLMMLLLISCLSFAQPPDFTLTVAPTPQTCLGNGTLSFTVTGTAAGASMAYEVFLLPNTTVPVATVNTGTALNLVAGDYHIIATQTVGGESNTASANSTIFNQVAPLVYNLTAGSIHCGGDGVITVNVISGTAVSYEIISGPETVPQQTSNIFSGLPVGQYEVRVYDNCGDAVVVTVQLVQAETNIIIDAGEPQTLVTCNSILAENYFGVMPGDEIFWPLTLTYTVFPPGGGASSVVTTTVTGGSTDYNFIQTEIPFFEGTYLYNLKITDACGNVFTKNNNVINLSTTRSWTVLAKYDPCFLNGLLLEEFVGISLPVTITFLEAPAGFDPVAYNPQHPVFNSNSIFYMQPGMLLPEGAYSLMLTDACGHELLFDLYATETNVAFNLEGLPGTCGNGGMKLCMAGKGAVVKEITDGPDEFSETYPVDALGELLENGDIDLDNLPPGNYDIHVIDECGNEFEGSFTVISTPGAEPQITQLPGCEEGIGSVSIDPGNVEYAFSEAYIVEAPASFTGTLPYTIFGNLASSGKITMDSLPEGNYKFGLTTQCGLFILDYNVEGYEVYTNNYAIVPHCGSFDLTMQHSSNCGDLQSYWIQKYDEANSTWGHPLTGSPYFSGAPTQANSVQLNNNTTNINQAYTGQFRIMKVFYTFTDGNTQLSRCIDIIHEFTFDGGPEITNAYSFPCDDGTAEVALVATGVPPLSYAITQKNGEPFAISNGTSALFENLEPAVYNFQVTDVCGNIRNIVFDMNTLDPMAIEAAGFCQGQDSSLTVPDFPFLIYQWYKEGSPGTILSASNSLLFPAFNPLNDIGIYAVHITSVNSGSCIDLILEYDATANALPNAGEDNTVSLCNEGSVLDLAIYLSTLHDNGGTWEDMGSTGNLNGSALQTAGLNAGTYQFKYLVTSSCGLTDEALIQLEFKDQPQTPTVNEVNPVCEGSDVQLSAGTVAGAAYLWNGPNGFTSAEQNPLLENVAANANGLYTLTITMAGNECASQPAGVAVAVTPGPQFIIEGSPFVCEGAVAMLAVNGDGFGDDEATYQWYYQDEPLPGETAYIIQVSQLGVYKVAVDYNGCTASREITVALHSSAFDIELQAGCIDENYIISVISANDIPEPTFSWTGPGGFTSAAPIADITGLATGEYSVSVTSSEGCTATASIMIDTTWCTIPKGVSPNDDEKNDTFDLSHLDVAGVKIFNRYGMLVYEAADYKKEWHGQSDKGDLPTGTYYYVVTLSAGKQVTGWVYLQREE